MTVNWKAMARKYAVALSLPVVLVSSGWSATVGQWSGNSSSSIWAQSGNFSTIYAAATAGPVTHSVASAQSITYGNLAASTHFIIANPTQPMNGEEINAIANWVYGGGILLLFADPDAAIGVSTINTILSVLGAGMSGNPMSVNNSELWGTGVQTLGGPLVGNSPAVNGVVNLQGAMLAFTQAYGVTGGSAIAGHTYQMDSLGYALRTDTFQLGRVYVFGGNFANNYNVGGGGANRQFLLNLLGPGSAPFTGSFEEAPEPATLILSGLGLAALVYFRRRRT